MNKWLIISRSKEYGNIVYKYDSPKEQVEAMSVMLSSTQKYRVIDGIQRVLIAIPDPYREKEPIEDFIQSYLSI
jgi:hypothetical protein